MAYKILTLFFLLYISTSAFTQDAGFVRQLNNKRLQGKEITKEVQKIIENGKIAGLSVIVINDNKVVYNKCFGYANQESKLPLTDSTIMYAASFTKPVSAAIFLKLMESNIMHLDTPIHRYLKKPLAEYEKWKDLTSTKNYLKITPRMILSHCSGIPILRYLYNDKLNLISEPGKKFYYSNEGMNLLGFVIEEYTGKSLSVLANEFIFLPLEMIHTSMIWEKRFETNYAVGYDSDNKLLGMDKRPVPKAAGSMSTTAMDYSKFIVSILNNTLLKSNLLNEMLKPHISIISNRGFGPQRDTLSSKYKKINLAWGIGLGLYQSKYGKAFFHTGHTDGWQNYFVAFPKKKTAIILMSNSSNFEKKAQSILNLCIGERTSPSNLEWLGYYDEN